MKIDLPFLSWIKKSHTYKRWSKKRKLYKKTGFSDQQLKILLINYFKSEEDSDYEFRFENLGGVNNLGMYACYKHKKKFAIAKLQYDNLAIRENCFMLWQQKYLKNSLSTLSYGICRVNTNYSFLISEYLPKPGKVDHALVFELFLKMSEVSTDTICELTEERTVAAIVNQIQPTTKATIKSLVAYVVSNPNSKQAFDYLENYFIERKPLLERHCEFENLYDQCFHFLSSLSRIDLSPHTGLVHGDFKWQNIMHSPNESGYRMIDLPYYTVGIRLWDLAFFYAKQSLPISEIIHLTNIYYPCSLFERRLFSFLYILVAILHIKPHRAKSLVLEKALPALEILSKNNE